MRRARWKTALDAIFVAAAAMTAAATAAHGEAMEVDAVGKLSSFEQPLPVVGAVCRIMLL